VCLLALVARVATVLQFQSNHPLADRLAIDEASYDRWAQAIASGDWLGEGVFFQEPLYSYFLGLLYSLAGRDLLLVRLLQAVVGAFTAWLVLRLAARLFGRAAGILAGAGMALHAPAWLLPCLLLKENLFLPVIVGLAWALASTRERESLPRWFAIGCLAGCGALLRGNLLAMAPWLVAWPLLRALRRGAGLASAARSCAGIACGLLLALGPAVVRNGRLGGVWLPTSGAGPNLHVGNAPENHWGRASELEFVRGIPEHEADDWRREAERRLGHVGRELGPGEVTRYWTVATLRSFAERPWEHAAQMGRKLRLALSSYEVGDNHDLSWDARFVPLLRVPWLGFGLWGMLGLAGALFLLAGSTPAGTADRHAALELLFLASLYLATIVLTMTSMRIRLALVPLLLPFAGFWMNAAWTRLRVARHDRPSLLQLMGAILLAAVIVHAPLIDAATRRADALGRDHNLAVELAREGRSAEARRIALALEAEAPGSSRIACLLAQCDLLDAEDLARAQDAWGAAERLRSARDWLGPFIEPPVGGARERHRVDALAARILYALEEWGEAERLFARALEFDGDDHGLELLRLRAAARAAEELPAPERVLALEELRARAQDLAGNEGIEAIDSGLARVELAEIEFATARSLLELVPPDAAGAQALRERALDALRELADRDGAVPVRVEALLGAARLQLYLGRPEAALRHVKRVLELDPAQPRARALLNELEPR
jgi:tetratricopeptide (TPR) repeat protein